ncbi:hypothetical protein [Thermosyntropha sp.]|uniref:hypothetical protein n=1 Tax=Thermosyntropha sp. TaxID=2740820 RepID=UPI0025CBD0FB|nr:hypothetical protein [Thermosyntropha sp.]MBO8159791.1 hypothetical protein [Thermosyntropha sp.]
MQFNEKFEAMEVIYQEMCQKVTNPKNFFFTEKYMKLRQTVQAVCLKTEKIFNNYIDVLMDDAEQDEFKQVKLYMCYPVRYLKRKKDKPLSDEKKAAVRLKLEQTAALGLMVHLFLVAEPAREKGFAKIDMTKVEKEWASRILRTDKVMKQYNIGVRKMPGKIFDAFYKEHIEPFITGELNIKGLLTKKRHYDFFHKLFFSGALLGLEIDFAARMLQD